MMFPPAHNRQMQMHRPPRNTKHSPQPHKSKHPRPQLRANIQFLLTRNHLLKRNIHNRCRRTASKIQQRGNKCEGYEVVAVPAGEQDQRREED